MEKAVVSKVVDKGTPPVLVRRKSKYWQEGSRKRAWVATTLGLLTTYLCVIGYAVFCELELTALDPWPRTSIVIGAFVISIAPLFFWWRETWTFETWVWRNPGGLSSDDMAFERERFKTNSEFARAFWTALLVVFASLFLSIKP